MSDSLSHTKIGFIGTGQMATALASGFVRHGGLSPDHIFASSPTDASRARFHQATGGAVMACNRQLVDHCDLIFLAVKPQVAPRVLKDLQVAQPNAKLFVSVIAGMRCDQLAAALSSDRLVRTLPTTPCLIGEGTAAVCGYGQATEEDVRQVEWLLGSVARTYRIPESQFDAVTGMANPAYTFQVIEALADGGVLMGLPRGLAIEMAAQSVRGAATMVLQLESHPAQLKDQVASPAGTTIAGLYALEQGGMRGLIMRGVEAATIRAGQLGGRMPGEERPAS